MESISIQIKYVSIAINISVGRSECNYVGATSFFYLDDDQGAV